MRMRRGRAPAPILATASAAVTPPNRRPAIVLACARNAVLGAAAAVLASACAAPGQRALVGTWVSDAARTLESMRATPGIPDDARRRLEADYYGHLVLEYRARTVRAYFDNSNYDSGRRPYSVVSADSERVVTSEWNELLGEFEESTAFRDGQCIFGLAADWGFREYFCPPER
jgi:hypothetical protein